MSTLNATTTDSTQKSQANTTKMTLIKKRAALEEKIQQWDKQRMVYVGQLAKRYRLTDLSNAILIQECRALQKKYSLQKKATATSVTSPHLHPSKKNTSPSAPATTND